MTFVTPYPVTLQSTATQEGWTMEYDNQGDPIDFNEVMQTWVSLNVAAAMLGYSRQYVSQILIARKRIRAYKHGTTYRGEWYVDPRSVEEYKRNRL